MNQQLIHKIEALRNEAIRRIEVFNRSLAGLREIGARVDAATAANDSSGVLVLIPELIIALKQHEQLRKEEIELNRDLMTLTQVLQAARSEEQN